MGKIVNVGSFQGKMFFQVIISHNSFSGSAKDAPIVTPLMDFIRQKRAAKGGSRVCF